MNAVVRIRNAATRRLEVMFPGFFPAAKHNHYVDFGYPEHLAFDNFYGMFSRNGLARAGVEKTILKTWQDAPFLLEKERDGSQKGKADETTVEADIRRRFADLRIWQHMAEADRRGMVGGYGALILRVGDNQNFDRPVDRVGGGLDGLIEVIPAWEGQLTVAEWESDQRAENYGHPAMYQFNEANVDPNQRNNRNFRIHPDRVVIWSKDGTVHCRSALEPGYNDLITLEKISGAGGEGFWKNAKSAPVFEVDKEAQIDQMARAMGIAVEDLVDKMNEQVEDWQKGFDKLLMLQGMQAKTLGVVLPSPEHFFAIALQGFAASLSIPLKILVGSQTGERASTEDANEWSQTIMSRRTSVVVPNVMALVNRLERFGILPERDWHLDWTDLTEASMAEKIDRANKMADTNQKMKDSGEFVFTPEEIREVVDMEPLSDAEKFRDEDDDEAEAFVTPADPE
jgi:hypothetical protein